MLIPSVLIVSLIGSFSSDFGSTAPSGRSIAGCRGSGDTVFIESRRGKTLEAFEVLRVKGVGPDAPFGALVRMTATPDGGVIVMDRESANGPQLLKFGRDGKSVTTLGRQGSGPGEYGELVGTVVVGPDSTVLVADIHGSRVIRFNSDGSHRKTALVAGLRGAAFPRLGGSFYNVLFDDGSGYAIGVDSLGRSLDTLRPKDWLPKRTSPTKFDPAQAWMPLPDGSVLMSRTDRIGFLIASRDGKGPPRVISLVSQPVPFGTEERRELQVAEDWKRDNFPHATSTAVTVPKFKQLSYILFDNGGPDVDGRLWLRIHAPAVKGAPRLYASINSSAGMKQVNVSYDEPLVLVGFNRDGTFLGEVRFPIDNPGNETAVSFVGDFAWVTTLDKDGEPVLIKYRITAKN